MDKGSATPLGPPPGAPPEPSTAGCALMLLPSGTASLSTSVPGMVPEDSKHLETRARKTHELKLQLDPLLYQTA